MKIVVYYLDGRIEEQGTDFLYNSQTIARDIPFHYSATLRTDDLSDGLWLECTACNNFNAVQKAPHKALVPPWEGRYDFQLLDVSELETVGKVESDGTPVLWRVGTDGPLVNGVKFNMQSSMFATRQEGTPVNEQAVDLWRALTGEDGTVPIMSKHEGESQTDYERRVAETMGWDYDCLYKFVQRDTALLSESVSGLDLNNVETLADDDVITPTQPSSVYFDPVTGEVFD